MRRCVSYWTICLLTLALFGGLVPAGGADPVPSQPAEPEPDTADADTEMRIIIGYSDALPERAEDLLHQNGGRVLRIDPALAFASASLPADRAERLLEVLTLVPGVTYAKEDGRIHTMFTPDDPRYGEQWGPAAIGMEAAWDIARGNHSIEVGVIDTGVDYTHSDLADNVCRNGPDFANGDDDPYDDHYHGTHVAGTVAAKIDNGIGVAGMADACIVPIKVLDAGGSGEWSDLASAIRWSADNGIEIISMSLGGCGGCDPGEPVTSAVQYADEKGVLMIAAAGNAYCGAVGYPAAYPEMIAVASVSDPGDQRSYFSSCGPEVEVAAPGHDILSTMPGDSYDTLSGTSMATPHVSGVAALLWSVNPGLNADAVRCIIAQNAVDLLVPGPDDETGYGRVDVPAMLGNPSCVPKPPTAVQLDALSGDGVIHLGWSKPFAWGGVTGYEVYRGPDAGNLTLYATLDGNTTGYTDAAVMTGTTYHYAVAAYNDAGTGEMGDPMAVQALDAVSAPQTFGFEEGLSGWTTTGLWHRTTDRSGDGNHSVYFGQENGPGVEDNDYRTGRPEQGTFTSPPLTVPTGNASVSFWQYAHLQSPYREHPIVQVSRDSDPFNFTTVWEMNGMRPYDGLGAVDLSAYAGETVHVRFVVDTVDAWYNWNEGWYVDEVAFKAEAAPAIAPHVEIVYPYEDQWIGQQFWTYGIFTDGNGDTDVTNVATQLDGEPATDTYVGDHSYDADFQVDTGGNHTLRAEVQDQAGLASNHTRVIRADIEAPSVQIATPTAGSIQACRITVTGTAEDTGGSGLRRATGWVSEDYGDGIGSESHANSYYFGGGDNGTYWLNLSTIYIPPGNMNIEVDVYDAAGNMNSTVVQVTKDDTTCEPVITVLSPEANGVVSGFTNVSFSVDFYENATGFVYVYAGGELLLGEESGDGYFDAGWNTTVLANGTYEVRIGAYDPTTGGWTEDIRTVHVYNPIVPSIVEHTYSGLVGCSVGMGALRTADQCGDASVFETEVGPGLTAMLLQVDWGQDQALDLDGLSVSIQVGGKSWSQTWDGGDSTLLLHIDEGLLTTTNTTLRVDVRAAHSALSPSVAYQESFDVMLTLGHWDATIVA